MTNNPFIFFEMNFDADLFKKYYGTIDSPGIYAIPEDAVGLTNNDTNPELDSNKLIDQDYEKNVNDSSPSGNILKGTDDQQQNLSGQQNVLLKQNEQALIQQTFSPDELADYEKEIEPMKKIFLINRLTELSNLIKDKFTNSGDLDLVLKYASYFSYKTLQILAMHVVDQIRNNPEMQQFTNNTGEEYNG